LIFNLKGIQKMIRFNSRLFWIIEGKRQWILSNLKNTYCLTLNFLPVIVLLAFFSCKKEETKPTPIPYVEPKPIKSPFAIKLIYPIADTIKPEIEVNPGDLVKLILRFTADDRINVIDLKIHDNQNGEIRLNDYPFTLTGYRPTDPANIKIEGFNSYDFFLTTQIRIPTYAKDSIILSAIAIKNNFSSRLLKLKFKIKKENDFKIFNIELNDNPYSGNSIGIYEGEGLSKFRGYVNSSQILTKLKAAIWIQEKEVKSRVIPIVKNKYDAYETFKDRYGEPIEKGAYNFSYSFSYNSYNQNFFFLTAQEIQQPNIKFKITAYSDSGDSTSLIVPLHLAAKDLVTAGPFNLGAPRNINFGQFLYTSNPYPVVSVNPGLGSSSYENFSIVGFFHQNGENRIGALSYINPLMTSLGYSNAYGYSNYARAYFKKITHAYESVDANYLDTVNINQTFPEVISVNENDVIVFLNNNSKLQKGVLKIHNIVPGDSGFVSLSCKYQKM